MISDQILEAIPVSGFLPGSILYAATNRIAVCFKRSVVLQQAWFVGKGKRKIPGVFSWILDMLVIVL